MADAPDWEVTTSPTIVTAAKLTSGVDASKSASPTVGDVYFATDTLILYVCAVAGTWTGFDAAILVQGTLLLARIPATLTGKDADTLDGSHGAAYSLQPTSSAPARALDTIYQNTTGKPILVIAWVLPPASAGAEVWPEIGSTSPPSTQKGKAYQGGTTQTGFILAFFVPADWYYRVRQLTGTWTLVTWDEMTW